MEMNQYLEVFIEESKEHLQTVNDALLKLEKDPTDLTIVSEIFRSAHTLKGMAATMGYQDLADLTHKLENVLDAVRNEQMSVHTDMLDVVFDSMDDLEWMVTDIASGGEGKKDVQRIVEKLRQIENGESPEEQPASSEPESAGGPVPTAGVQVDQFEQTVLKESMDKGYNTYEITITLDENCLLKGARVYMVFEQLEQVGEVVKSTPTVDVLEAEDFDLEFSVLVITEAALEDLKERILKVSEVQSVVIEPFKFEEETVAAAVEEEVLEVAKPQQTAPEAPKQAPKAEETQNSQKQTQNKTIRVNIERLDVLMNLFEELVIDRGRLEQISSELNQPELQETVERMSRISGDLQNIILNMRMVPVEQVFNRFPRMVRQLARDLGKEVNLSVHGAETELDRTVIDEIGDPLVHLIRNALDHGLETPDVRKASGKESMGTIELRAYHSGNHVFIEISDDGAGINRDKVLDKALSNGVVTPEQASTLTDRQIYELIMASGFSTADKISDISGRGVGLDVVKNTIESLGGSITIDSTYGEGSTFSIQLPLTLSIISVMLIEIGQEKYAVPLSSIIETAIIQKEDIMYAHNKKVIDFRGKVVPLVFLEDVLGTPESERKHENHYSVVVVRKGDKMAAIVVDSFIGQQEVVLKTLGTYLTNVHSVFAISGATILGDGQVALIIDTNALIK
ncbi:chemotaxis protein CheA [Pontibacillus halophilus JSM 076056 = DSM 19796]|uniref:Chemotaxis protein CheA n=1 Tax=Pontibacillus halophilus JSM 076056 = DSM 19796 TaxID=1385510 RepID=A0A0A5IBD5_9BACI|nr:chemotaxis protein CheA [Pontibacillus halophilus]KGX93152.1 chemotaxis protein CheA [Pontibacillus halophilus JSM 076056 = DSM 19796]